jgi:hypothetical protein
VKKADGVKKIRLAGGIWTDQKRTTGKIHVYTGEIAPGHRPRLCGSYVRLITSASQRPAGEPDGRGRYRWDMATKKRTLKLKNGKTVLAREATLRTPEERVAATHQIGGSIKTKVVVDRSCSNAC